MTSDARRLAEFHHQCRADVVSDTDVGLFSLRTSHMFDLMRVLRPGRHEQGSVAKQRQGVLAQWASPRTLLGLGGGLAMSIDCRYFARLVRGLLREAPELLAAASLVRG